MRIPRFISCLLFSVTPFISWAQSQPLAESRRSSYYTYIVKLSREQADKFNAEWSDYIRPENFTNIIDSFPTDSTYKRKLPEGNYLFIKVEDEMVNATLHLEHSFRVDLVPVNSELAISVLDSTGKPITNAKVKIGKYIIPYNPSKMWYSIPKSNKKGLLEVSVGDCVVYHTISRYFNNNWALKILRIIRYSMPIRYTVWGFNKIFTHHYRYYDYNPYSEYSYTNKEKGEMSFKLDKKTRGYIDFNKPKYQPNDTVKCKVYIVNKKGKPYKKPLYFCLYKKWGYGKPVFIKQVKPALPGAYNLNFPLTDSLQLDENYMVLLARKGRKDFYVLRDGSFRYEDYQLDKTTYHATLNKKEFVPGDSIILKASGTDANGLPLLDAKVKVVVTEEQLKNCYKDSVYVKDTLWTSECALNDARETRLSIPDSVIPPVSADYNMHIYFNNSNLETHDTVIYFSVNEFAEALELHTAGSSIIAIHRGNSIPGDKYYLRGLDKDDDIIFKRQITLPHIEPINPLVGKYALSCAHRDTELYIRDDSSGVNSFGMRTKDSVHFYISNSNNLPIYYCVYKEQKKIESGNISGPFLWKAGDKTLTNYGIICTYLWAGEHKQTGSEATISNKDLNIEIKQPLTISPGDKADVSISVKDFNGKPVPGMNITAACVNSQFKENSSPTIPYFGKEYYFPDNGNVRMSNEDAPISGSNYITPIWIKRFHLDTISYYKALFPKDGLYEQYDSMGKAEAQFAPYVFSLKWHEMMPIATIYIDSDFVYYYNTTESQPYSFIGTPGYHNVYIRLHNKTLYIKHVLFRKNYKLQMCIDDTTTNDKITFYVTLPYFSAFEKKDISLSILHLEHTLGYGNYYIWQNSKVRILHNPGYDYGRNSTIDLGPFQRNYDIHFANENSFNYTLPLEGDYSYEANRNQYVMLRQRNEQEPDFLPSTTSSQPRFGDTAFSYSDIVLNTKPIHFLPFVTDEPSYTRAGNGTFRFFYPGDSTLYAIAMERNKNDSSNYWLFHGYKNFYFDLAPGVYRFQFINKQRQYFETTVTIHPNATFCKVFSKPKWSKLDTNGVPYGALFKNQVFMNLNDGYCFGKGKIKVVLTDKDTKQPVAFAQVVVLDANNLQIEEMISDENGMAESDGLGEGTYNIRVYYAGYADKYCNGISVKGNVLTLVILPLFSTTDTNIQTVSIIRSRVPLLANYSFSGGSVDIQHMASGNINSIAAESAGVYAADVGGYLNVRGGRSGTTQYIVDGQKVTPGQAIGADSLKTAFLHLNVRYLGDESLEENNNSVNAPNTNDSITQRDIAAKSMRNHYSDYAYWEPNLMTNENGEAKFSATFPDNITGWKAHAEGIDNKKRSGIGYAFTRSFRKISAELEMPRFLIAGDYLEIIGKALNYTSQPYPIKYTFVADAGQPVIKDTLLTKAIITSYPIKASNSDSLHASFEIALQNGYSDGEDRSIPILPVGVHEKTGTFLALNRDTTCTLSFDTTKGAVYLHMDSDPFDLLQGDISYLRQYPYECNEQISSKILALLAEKKIKEARDQKFKDGKLLQKLLNKLTINQNKDGSWGWWESGNANPWMTAYVLNALNRATSAGYVISDYIMNNGYDYLRWSLKLLDNKNVLLLALKTLSDAGQAASYDSLMKHINTDSLNAEQLLIYEKIAKKQGLKYDVSRVMKIKKQTLMGNVYWAGIEDGWYNNSMACTIAAFDLFSTDSAKTYLCESMFNYFMEERKYGGSWMNTIQTARLIDILTPYIISHHKLDINPPTLSIRSKNLNKDIHTYSFTGNTIDNLINIHKTGSSPVYFTAYQSVFNSNPKPIDNRFEIKTIFKSNNEQTDTLAPGEPLTLLIEVNVKQKGDYLMLSVPIPAGCSYGSNENNHDYEEVHREQYKDHTDIYFEQLNPGHYEFKINLQARFAGVYTLNPAQMESMYFPTLNGRNSIRKISIKY